MSDQPEALRLADALEQQAAWEARYGPSELEELLPDSATLLRRQHAEIERLYAQRSSAVEDYEKVPDWSLLEATQGALREHMAEIHKLRAERDALRAELREATEAMDDPAVNNLRTLPEAIRLLCAENAALLSALLEVVRVFESAPSSICDTVWVTGDSAETLYDRCRAAIETERETR